MKALVLILALLAAPALAVEPDEILPDPAQEARAREISKNLRCLVCRNQSIDDSDAGLAKDLRIIVRERITAGDDNEEAVDFIVDRYGDYVLLKPRFSAGTAVLYLGGPILFLIGAGLFWRSGRGRRAAPEIDAPAPLSDEERRRLDTLTSGKS